MQVIPRDQTSTLPSYWPSSIASITSGAIQYGVPTNELAGLTADAEPKSATITNHVMQSINLLLTDMKCNLNADENRLFSANSNSNEFYHHFSVVFDTVQRWCR